jgi:hypothetical protein
VQKLQHREGQFHEVDELHRDSESALGKNAQKNIPLLLLDNVRALFADDDELMHHIGENPAITTIWYHHEAHRKPGWGIKGCGN